MKNVLYISYDGLTDPLGQSQVLPYLVQLSKEGYRFTILSFEKEARFQKEAATIHKIVQSAGIAWAPLMFTAKPPVLSKIYDRYRMWRKAVRLYKKHRFELIHCRSYVAAEVGLKLKRKFGAKFLFDMRGFWADEKVDNGQWDLSKPLFKKIYHHYKQKEKEFLLNADGIVSLTEAGKQYLISQPHYGHLSITVIPCCADLDHFDYHRADADRTDALRKKLGIGPHTKVITYLGSVGGWYMTKEMFSFFSALLSIDPAYHMLILTKDDAEAVKAEAQAFGIPREKLTVTYSNRQELPAYLALSAVSLFFIRDTFSKKASSPTKHAELMGMGIPVVCNDIGDTGNIIRQTETGIVVNEFDNTSIGNAIRQMQQLNVSPEKIRQAAKEIFDLKSGAASYHSLYRQLVG